MTQHPDAGWYTDPEDSQQVRWWNGVAWSDQRTPLVPQPTPVAQSSIPLPHAEEYVPMANYGQARFVQAPPTRKEKDREVCKNNAMAYTGLVLSLVAFLLNPFGVVSILGIVFSSIGFAKANELQGAGYSISGRGTAKAGIILGILGLAAFGYFFLQ
jgi:hypothetical protein